MLTAQQVQNVTFSTVRLGLGYDMVEVDDLLDRLGETLRNYEQGGQGRDVTADELSAATFRETKLREGYKPAEIDAFLQEAIETLRAYEAAVAGQGTPAAAAPVDQGPAHAPPVPPAAPAGPVAPGEQPQSVPITQEAPLADAETIRPMRRPSGYASATEEGLGVNEVVHRLQSLQATQDGGLANAPLQVRTPDGRTFTIAAVKSSPGGLVITLAN